MNSKPFSPKRTTKAQTQPSQVVTSKNLWVKTRQRKLIPSMLAKTEVT